MASELNPLKDETLIELVESFPQLYNKKNPKYKDRNAQANAWQCIGNEFEKTTAEECLSRWTLLRNRFSKERSKLASLPSGTAPISEWELYQKLLFLSPFIARRRTFGNVKTNKNEADFSESMVKFVETITSIETTDTGSLMCETETDDDVIVDPETGETLGPNSISEDSLSVPKRMKKNTCALSSDKKFEAVFEEAVGAFKDYTSSNMKTKKSDVQAFCSSLAFSLEGVPKDVFLDCQIEIMNVIRKYKTLHS